MIFLFNKDDIVSKDINTPIKPFQIIKIIRVFKLQKEIVNEVPFLEKLSFKKV
jgi:hypothetical protein